MTCNSQLELGIRVRNRHYTDERHYEASHSVGVLGLKIVWTRPVNKELWLGIKVSFKMLIMLFQIFLMEGLLTKQLTKLFLIQHTVICYWTRNVNTHIVVNKLRFYLPNFPITFVCGQSGLYQLEIWYKYLFMNGPDL